MKQLMIKFCFMSLLITLSLGVRAQNKVSGKLIDSSTKEPLIGATVYLESDPGVGTVTSLDGTFALQLEKGEVVLKFSYIGYVDKTQKVGVNGDTNVGEVALSPDAVGLNEVQVMASVVTDRRTPVAVSSIQAELISEKLGSQEYPELLKTTPSVYTSKEGGGFGDATVYVRGFDSNNVGVLINGVPVNDMENGKVYWSNWAGLSDVSRTMQVQRGLGASKLGLSSVGGTINILTKSTDAKKGGVIKSYIGNSGYRKQLVSFSTGLMDNGWAISALGSHTYSDGYIKGTNFDAWSYFLNVAKKINDSHTLAFTLVGAPQWHNQRGNKHTIAQYRNHKDELRFNSDYGIREGKIYGGGYGYNYYHKPQAQLNHYWKMNETTRLSTSLYGSVGSGGGRRISGEQSGLLGVNRDTGEDRNETLRTPDGLLDFGAVQEINRASVVDGSQAIVGNSVNNHQWVGILSTFMKDVNAFKYTFGLDGRYYVGEHYREVDDLLGGKFFIDDSNINRDSNTKLLKGDKYSYHNDGNVLYTGLFAQAEYVAGDFTSFFSTAISRKSYKRIDYFNYTPENQETEWEHFLPWNVKAGASYKLSQNHSVFGNGGYIKRTPYFTNVFINYGNTVNDKAVYETIITTELGYTYTSPIFNAKFSAYRTNWMDRGLVMSLQGETANITDINQLHQGLELEATFRPSKKLSVKGMVSYGDWIYQDDVDFALFNEENEFIGNYKANLKDIHVGNSAQFTGALELDYKVLPNLKLGVDYIYYDKHYSNFDPKNNLKKEEEATASFDSWQLPAVGLVDFNFNYKFSIGGLDATIYGNVNNLFNTEYISKADDGSNHDEYTSLVFYGFGTTWSSGLKIKF